MKDDYKYLGKTSVKCWLLRHKSHKKVTRVLSGEGGKMILISCECGENIVQDTIETNRK